MKRILLSILALIVGLTAMAQMADAQRAIDGYEFLEAEGMLAKVPESDSLQYAHAQLLKQQVRVGYNSMNAIERVAVIDSIILPKENLLQAYALSSTSGRLAVVPTIDNHLATAYMPERGDRRYTSHADAQGQQQLYVSFLSGGKYIDEVAISGIFDDEEHEMMFPFVMDDGLTIYFAARGPKSIGGWDIYMTRFDLDERRFLKPQNVGMPINSPANDFLYVVDEEHNIGWFATDRNMPQDSLCIYTFVPNEVRHTYPREAYTPEKLVSLARIGSIADTWTDKAFVAERRSVLAELRQAKPATQVSPQSSTPTFSDPEMQKRYDYYQEGLRDLTKKEAQLTKLRKVYHEGKKVNADQILALEGEVEKLRDDLAKQKKQIRTSN